MNKDQVAIYLNGHLEFFNEYPELLRKIQGWPGITRTQTQIVLSSYIEKESSTLIKK